MAEEEAYSKTFMFFFQQEGRNGGGKSPSPKVSYFFLPTTCSFAIPKKILEEKKKAYLQEFLIIHSENIEDNFTSEIIYYF